MSFANVKNKNNEVWEERIERAEEQIDKVYLKMAEDEKQIEDEMKRLKDKHDNWVSKNHSRWVKSTIEKTRDKQQESEVILDDGYSYANGGQVMDQNTLVGLAILSEMANKKKAYDDTPLEEKQPTISEVFASKGKTLGGSNTKSLSQMLGV